MAAGPLPPELQEMISERWPCREAPLRQLSALLRPGRPLAPVLVVYGPTATGKSGLVCDYLQTTGLRHAVVRCRECVTGRHMLERMCAAVRHALRRDGVEVSHSADAPPSAGWRSSGRCDSLSSVAVQLQHLLPPPDSDEPFILVLDDIIPPRDSPPKLLPALARLPDLIPSLHLVFVLRQHPSASLFHRSGIPHVAFPAYNRQQTLQILAQHPPAIFLASPTPEREYDEEAHAEDRAWLWPRFCAAVWDSLGQAAARDLRTFREVCGRLWRPFVAPIVSGDFGTRDFSRLLVTQRRLFQDESVLVAEIVKPPAASLLTTNPPQALPFGAHTKDHTRHLPYYAQWLLLAAYLASFTPARTDAIHFMKNSITPRHPRRQRRLKTASHITSSVAHRRRLLVPSPFPLDRLLAIFHALIPHPIRACADVYTLVASLARLRLLVTVGETKWKVGPAVSAEVAGRLARDVGVEGEVEKRWSMDAAVL
ncbi:MAG: hypothetical protein FE78DRAFT_76668 [Acidomyces sp. 'richmondensis']|nr:MAG: hypothetical protein FE78DRAFT_76668 [Acidomyces sp. 'richmondensis']